jgi:hypothetical protein
VTDYTSNVSARELYGRGSAAETAVIQAWDAVGVDVGVNPAAGPSGDGRAAAKTAVGTAIRKIRQLVGGSWGSWGSWGN